MKNKTIWQWMALIGFCLGLLCNVVGWITKDIWTIMGEFVFYGICLYCVVFHPIE